MDSRAYFAWAVQEAQRNPVAGVKRVVEQKKAPRWLIRREMSALAGAVQKYGNTRDLALVVVVLLPCTPGSGWPRLLW